MRIAAVIVAAGTGSRLGGDVPKQFRTLTGRSVLQRSVDAFLALPEIWRVICVIGQGQEESYRASVGADARVAAPVTGGASRQASVRAGLQALADDPPDVVLVHDALDLQARPAEVQEEGEAAAGGPQFVESMYGNSL